MIPRNKLLLLVGVCLSYIYSTVQLPVTSLFLCISKGPLVNHLILKIDLCGIIFANHHLRWPRCILLSLIFVTSQLPLSLGALTLLTWERHIFKADGHPMPEGKLKAQKEIMAPEIFMVHQVYGSTVDELCFLSPSSSF
jgi:hypothetical protein